MAFDASQTQNSRTETFRGVEFSRNFGEPFERPRQFKQSPAFKQSYNKELAQALDDASWFWGNRCIHAQRPGHADKAMFCIVKAFAIWAALPYTVEPLLTEGVS